MRVTLGATSLVRLQFRTMSDDADTNLQADPLQGATVAGYWDWVYDFDGDYGGGFVTGQFLLRSDGVLLRRGGGSSYSKGATTYSYREWVRAGEWEPGVDPAVVIASLKGMYSLAKPSPVPPDQRTAGPFPGSPEPAEYL